MWVIQHLPQIIYILCGIVFLLVCWSGCRFNLPKGRRQRQIVMPLIAVVFSLAVLADYSTIAKWMDDFILGVTYLIQTYIPQLITWWNTQGLPALNTAFFATVLFNIAFLLLYHPVKRILLMFIGRLGPDAERGLSYVFRPFYEYDEQAGTWQLKGSYSQVRKILRACLIVAAILGTVLMELVLVFPNSAIYTNPYLPVFGILILAEVYYFLSGLTNDEQQKLKKEESLGVEPSSDIDYTSLFRAYKEVFGSRILDAGSHREPEPEKMTLEEILEPLKGSDEETKQLAAVYLSALQARDGEVDLDRASAMIDIMNGKSVVFSSPFYRDYTDYVLFALNRALLRGSKALLVYGPQTDCDDVVSWLRSGLDQVTCVPGMWEVAKLGPEASYGRMDAGFISFSDVNDYAYLETHRAYISTCDTVILFSPSSLMTTCQIGLNMLARMAKPSCTCIAFDINVDGLVDSLSHALMTEFVEVKATGKRRGVANVIHWDADGNSLSLDLFDDVTRYLGMGTELGAVAVKNGVDRVEWYGRNNVPLSDARWLAMQYYRQICTYMDIPVSQNDFDTHLKYCQGIWGMDKSDSVFAVVEDEQNNLFEMYRQLSTRSNENGFLNVVSPDYLLREYMYGNSVMFRNDPKAITMVAADYVMSLRNTLAQIIMQLSHENMHLSQVEQRLRLVGFSGELDYDTFIDLLAEFFCDDPEEDLTRRRRRYARAIVPTMVKVIDHATFRLVEDEQITFTKDKTLAQSCFVSLKNAYFTAEDEKMQVHTLGSRLNGHMCQQLLPGQFTTIDGKYYEALELLPNGGVLLRRAADHYHGRMYYRQLRTYNISEAKPVYRLGRTRTIDGIKATMLDARVSVRTDGYMAMTDYGDFSRNACRPVFLEQVPVRVYCKKSVLSLEFAGATRQEIVTLSFVLNELLRTLYPNDYPYISVTCPYVPGPFEFAAQEEDKTEEEILDHTLVEGDDAVKERSAANADVLFEDVVYDLPLGALHALKLNDANLSDCAIYIVEDSQIDLGLLSSVDRNIDRLLGLVRDYLDWHVSNCEESAASGIDGWLDQVVDRGIVAPQSTEDEYDHPRGLWGYIRSIMSGRKCKASDAAQAQKASNKAKAKANRAATKKNKKAQAEAKKAAEEAKKAQEKADREAKKAAAKAAKEAKQAEAKAAKEAKEAKQAEAKAAKEAKAAQAKAAKEAKAAQDQAEQETKEAQKKAEQEASQAEQKAQQDAKEAEQLQQAEEAHQSAAWNDEVEGGEHE